MTILPVQPLTSFTDMLKYMYSCMSQRRKIQLLACILLMVMGAVAELVTIGAALPFLVLIASPEKLNQFPRLIRFFTWIGADNQQKIFFDASLILCLAVFSAMAVRLLLIWVSQKFVLRLGHDIATRIYDRLLHQAFEYHASRSSSEVLAGMEKVQTVTFGVLLPGMTGAISAFIALLVVALLIAIDPFTAIVAAIMLGSLYIAVSLGTRRILQGNGRIIARSHTQRTQHLQEGLGGIRDILVQHSQPFFLDAFRRIDDEYRKAQAVNFFISSSPRLVMESIGILIIVLLALYLSFQSGGLTDALPNLGMLVFGAQRLLPQLQLAYMGWSQATGNLNSLEDVVALMAMPIDVGTSPPGIDSVALPLREAITLNRVGFSYARGESVLHSIELSISRGERIGLIGKTGSGKSTLLDIIMGLLEPQKGEILIDDMPLTTANRANWQLQIAHVPQTIFLADASIAANIAFGDDPAKIDMNRIRSAAAHAQLLEFIETMPDGFASRIGERGVRLSGGQRQRLGIARALYKNKSVLILDEATSALDDGTEKAVMEAISGLDGVITVLMIAHRLSTLADCNRVVRMHEGRIVQVGTYTEVVNNPNHSALI